MTVAFKLERIAKEPWKGGHCEVKVLSPPTAEQKAAAKLFWWVEQL